MSERLSEIKAKCEQYWNESGPFVPEEVHSILEFIHVRACMAQDELALLRRAVKELDHDLHRKCKVIAILQNGGQVGPAAGAPHLPLDVLEFIKEQEGASLAEDR